MLKLIENIKKKKNLNYLLIRAIRNDNINISSIILQNLGQILPYKLDLKLYDIKASDIEKFSRYFH
jgi:hypothetical protein